jgi:cyclophilin family peptidyl-prolyl cis-trans isomerase
MFAFFKVSVAGATPETIVFELNSEKCKKTSQNFMSICNSRATAKRPPTIGAHASSHETVLEPTYRGTEFHRIIPQFMIQGGDFTSFDGKGGFAASTTNDGKPTFPDECFDISHDREGILSMANRGKNTNGSQFFITLGKALHLDGKHVAFGKVVRGMDCVRRISQVETDGNGKPVLMQRVMIIDCGVGTGDNDSGSSDSSSSNSSSSSSRSSSVSSKRTKKKRRRSEKKHKSSSKQKKRKRSERYRDEDDERDYSRRRKKKSREKTSHRHRKRERGSSREREDEKSKKRHRKDDERHHKRKRH